MWHASVAYHGRHPLGEVMPMRTERALRALSGVGDAQLGEWVEQSPAATHVRRRLTAVEAHGWTLRDIRATAEAEARWLALPRWIREQVPSVIVAEEIGA